MVEKEREKERKGITGCGKGGGRRGGQEGGEEGATMGPLCFIFLKALTESQTHGTEFPLPPQGASERMREGGEGRGGEGRGGHGSRSLHGAARRESS